MNFINIDGTGVNLDKVTSYTGGTHKTEHRVEADNAGVENVGDETFRLVFWGNVAESIYDALYIFYGEPARKAYEWLQSACVATFTDDTPDELAQDIADKKRYTAHYSPLLYAYVVDEKTQQRVFTCEFLEDAKSHADKLNTPAKPAQDGDAQLCSKCGGTTVEEQKYMSWHYTCNECDNLDVFP